MQTINFNESEIIKSFDPNENLDQMTKLSRLLTYATIEANNLNLIWQLRSYTIDKQQIFYGLQINKRDFKTIIEI